MAEKINQEAYQSESMQESQLPAFFTELTKQLGSAPKEVRRLFHGRGKCWPGLEQLTCDWAANQLLVNLFKPVSETFLSQLKQGLMAMSDTPIWQQLEGKSIAIQHRYSDGAPTEVVWGELITNPVVEELGCKYQLDIGRNQNFGLFLDMRKGREWVKTQANGKRVLNLFAYTCGFSVAAISGGAEHVVNVDMARASLNKGRDNHRLNGHDTSKVTFLAHDIFKSWGKIKKYGPYDIVVIDPPSFQKGSFALTKDYKKILRRLCELMTEDGQVMACVNSPSVTPNFLVDSMSEEAPQLKFIERIPNPPEFADKDEQASLKVLLFK